MQKNLSFNGGLSWNLFISYEVVSKKYVFILASYNKTF